MPVKYIDLHARGEPPFPSWDDPRHDEPAHGYLVRLVGLNDQLSASAVASSFGLNGRDFQPTECLDFAMSFPIENKERLLSATPTVNKASVTMFGETFRRRDWSIEKRYFCPGCLAEDAYHRSFWDLVAFRHCPFHNQPLCCVDRSGHAVPWWSPSFEHSPFGHPIAEYRKRASSVRPSIESYTLGRLGVIEKVSIPLLDGLAALGGVFAAVEFAGKLVIGGRREKRPSLTALGKDTVFNAGFDILQQGNEAIDSALKDVAANACGGASRKHRSLQFIFGWAYRSAKASREFGAMFTDRMIELAATQTGLARRVSNLNDVKGRLRLTDPAGLSRELGVSEAQIRKIATTLGLRGACSRKSIYYFAFSDEETRLLRRTIAELVDRDEAAKLLDVPRRFFDSLVDLGLVRRLIRLAGNGAHNDRFRPEDIESFGTSLFEKAEKRDALPATGRLLKHVKRTSRTNPARLVHQLISGELPLLGRQGDTFGSIIIPARRIRAPQATTLRTTTRSRVRNDTDGIGMLDAAAVLGVDDPTVVALKKLGFLKSSKHLPKLLDRREFEIFCKKYCASRYYASILGCHPQRSGRRLEDLGVKVIRLELTQGVIRLVNRVSARRALDLKSDPDRFMAGSPQAFIAGLADQIREETTFRLVSQNGCLVFRTGKGTLSLYVTINWKRRVLEVGLRYNLLRTPATVADLRLRKSVIKAAFNGEWSWMETDKSLRIYRSMDKLPFGSPSQWPGIYVQIVESFCNFKKHFEPPQRRWKTRT